MPDFEKNCMRERCLYSIIGHATGKRVALTLALALAGALALAVALALALVVALALALPLAVALPQPLALALGSGPTVPSRNEKTQKKKKDAKKKKIHAQTTAVMTHHARQSRGPPGDPVGVNRSGA